MPRTAGRRRWMMITAVLVVLSTIMWISTFDGSSATGMAVLGGYRDRWFVVTLFLSYLAVCAALIAVEGGGRSAIFKVTALSAGFLFVLVALELVAVVGLLDYRRVTTRKPTKSAEADERLRQASLPNIRTEGEVVPDLARWLGADAEPLPYAFETDRYGLRNRVNKEDPRVVCLGDSILVAGLLPVEAIVTERLEKPLGVPVLNVAESGYAPQEQFVRLETTGLDLDGRLIVHFIFEGNDLADSRAWRQWRNRTFETRWPESGLLKTLLRLLDRPRRAAGRRRTGLFPKDASSPETVYFLYDNRRIDSETEWPHVREVLLAARDDVVSEGGRYAIVVVPAKLTVLHPFCSWPPESELDDPDRWESKLRPDIAQLCAEENIPHLDLTTALRSAAATGELPYFANDTHLNELGHEVMAETLAPWIAELIETE